MNIQNWIEKNSKKIIVFNFIVIFLVCIYGAYKLGNLHGFIGTFAIVSGYDCICNASSGLNNNMTCYIGWNDSYSDDQECFELKGTNIRVIAGNLSNKEIFFQNWRNYLILGKPIERCNEKDRLFLLEKRTKANITTREVYK